LAGTFAQYNLHEREGQIQLSHFNAVSGNAWQLQIRLNAPVERPYCIFSKWVLEMLAFVLGQCRWLSIFGRLLVVY